RRGRGVAGDDGGGRLAAEGGGGQVVVVVAEVGADDDERGGFVPHVVEDGGDGVRRTSADGEGQDGDVAEDDLQEGQLNLQAVLVAVGGVGDGQATPPDEVVPEGDVDGDDAEGSGEVVHARCRHPRQRSAVGGAEEDDASDVVPARHPGPGAGRHRAGIGVAGVRGDDRLRR